MKYHLLHLASILMIIVIGQSCTVQKCHYSRGFNVSLKKGGINLRSSSTSENHSFCTDTSFDLQDESGALALNNSVTAEFSPTVLSHSSQGNGVKNNDNCEANTQEISSKGRAKVMSSVKNEVCSKVNRGIKGVFQASLAPLAPDWLVLVICFFIPPLAVALMTNGNIEKILIALLLWFLGLVPGIVYAFLVFFHFL